MKANQEVEAANDWLTRDQVGSVCPACACRMENEGISRVKASVFLAKMTWQQCIDKAKKNPSVKDPEKLCGGLKQHGPNASTAAMTHEAKDLLGLAKELVGGHNPERDRGGAPHHMLFNNQHDIDEYKRNHIVKPTTTFGLRQKPKEFKPFTSSEIVSDESVVRELSAAAHLLAAYPDSTPTEKERKLWREQAEKRRRLDGVRPRK